MKILWLSWKDRSHPLAGGAEVVKEELARRLVTAGHDVTLIVGGFKGGVSEELRDGFRIIRIGNRLSVYYKAWRFYRSHLKNTFDLVIDEVNTIPFFAKYYVSEPNIVFAHMLCKQIWFYQLPPLLGVVGYLLEPIYLRLLADRRVVTISNSTRNDLIRHGFKSGNITIISEGIEFEPVSDLDMIKKYDEPTLLSFGSVRAMKRTADQIDAFAIAKQTTPHLKLKIAGDASDRYGQKILRKIEQSPYHNDIDYIGHASNIEKIELMQKSHLILVTSVKEGWGLIVTEAASQGTPAVVYDVDGLRDSVINTKTGYITKRNTPRELAFGIRELLRDELLYTTVRRSAWTESQRVTFDRACGELLLVLDAVRK